MACARWFLNVPLLRICRWFGIYRRFWQMPWFWHMPIVFVYAVVLACTGGLACARILVCNYSASSILVCNYSATQIFVCNYTATYFSILQKYRQQLIGYYKNLTAGWAKMKKTRKWNP